MTLGILKSTKSYHEKYAISCEELGIPCVIVDGLAPDWLQQVQAARVDGWLVRPPGEYPELRALYQERLSLLHRNMGLPIYPTLAELELYENKRHLADWLALYGYPHPETRVFADKESALAYVRQADYPLVFKSNVGWRRSGCGLSAPGAVPAAWSTAPSAASIPPWPGASARATANSGSRSRSTASPRPTT